MTFDDGILGIYDITNNASAGGMPVPALRLKEQYYYGYAELGITRYYQAKAANQLIDCVVNVPGWNDIKVTDVCVLEDGVQYQISMVQTTRDENGLKIMRLSLERVELNYEVPG